jgi:hypothetical protein
MSQHSEMRPAARLGAIGLGALGWWAIAAPPAEACVPVAQIGLMFGGPLIWASTFGMVLAVAVKCISFWRHEQRLPGWARVATMVAANVLSTFVAVGYAGWYQSEPEFSLIFNLPLLFLLPLAWRGSRAWATMTGLNRAVAGLLGMLLLFGLQVAALNLFAVAFRGYGEHEFAAYWAFKVGCVILGSASALLVTIVVEEAVIGLLGRKQGDDYLPTVARANLAAFLVVAVFGALMALPHRLIDGDYLHQPAPLPIVQDQPQALQL